MIWTSIPLMTAFDLVVMAVVVFSIVAFARTGIKRQPLISKTGPLLINVGLLSFGLFYFIDLLVMHALPLFIPMAEAMAHMENLHQNLQWFFVLIAVSSIVAGFLLIVKNQQVLVRELNKNLELRVKEGTQKLHENQEKLNLALTSANIGTWIRNLADDTVIWDHRTEAIFSLEPGTFEGTMEAFLDMVHPEDREKIIRAHDRSKNFDIPYDNEYRVIAPDGGVRYVVSRARAIRDIEGTPTQITGVLLDITERKRIEKAERENEAKAEFLASITHELRTPMNAILGFAQLLRMPSSDSLSTQQRESVDQILLGGNHLLNLIDDILDLSQIESGNLGVIPETVDSEIIIRESLDLIRNLAVKHGIKINYSWEGSAPTPAVTADFTRFKQVLLNLLSNAVKYNHEDGSVTLMVEQTDDGMLRLTITDTGPGVSEERQAELFKPFSRLGLESSNIPGTGIGLTISKKLVEEMDGRIGFQSEVGKGSSFWFELPLAPEGAKPTTTETAAVETDMEKDKMRSVLYVEDNPANLQLMQALLRRLPFIKMLSAHTGELGLEMAEAHHPDAILMDINLPGIDGFKALEHLKGAKATEDIPIIALTSRAMPKDVERGLQAGFHAYLTKPIQIDKVLGALESAFGNSIERRDF